MEPTSQQLLAAVRKTLAERIAPNVTHAGSSLLIGTVLTTLDEMLRREELGVTAREGLHARLVALVRRGKLLTQDKNAPSFEDAWPQRPLELMPSQEPESSIEVEWRRLVALVTALLGMRADKKLDATTRAAIQTYLEDVAQAEIDQKKIARSETGAMGQLISIDSRLEKLTPYLAMRLGDGPNFAIHHVKQLAGGFSNQTYKLMIGESTDSAQPIVIRIARANSIQWPFTTSLEEELPFIELAHASGLPVPRQLWLETDRSLLGGMFHVMDYVPGVLRGNYMAAYDDVSDTLIANVADVLAQMHRLPWQEWVGQLPTRIAPRANLTINDAMDLILQRMRTYLDAAWLSPSPVILLLFDWLERHRPVSDAPPVVTHGDLGFHNWLFDGDMPSAVLDWENVALCGATKDLANVKDCLIPAKQWDHFLDCYVKAGGSPPVAGEMRFYGVLRQIQSVICCASSMEKMFISVAPGNIDFLELGFAPREYFYLQIEKQLAELVEFIKE